MGQTHTPDSSLLWYGGVCAAPVQRLAMWCKFGPLGDCGYASYDLVLAAVEHIGRGDILDEARLEIHRDFARLSDTEVGLPAGTVSPWIIVMMR